MEKLDWIGFDACLMSTAEVASLVSPYARYMVASEENEPGFGWNYNFLKGMESDEDPSVTGQRVIASYFDYCKAIGYDAGKSVLASINLEKLPVLMEAMNGFFGDIALNKDNFPEISNARRSVSAFGRNEDEPDKDADLVDLGSLVEVLGKSGYAKDGENVRTIIEGSVYCRTDREDVTGLSVYFPFYNEELFRKGFSEYEKMGYCDSYTDFISEYGSYMFAPTEDTYTIWNFLQAQIPKAKDTRTLLQVAMTEEQARLAALARIIALYQGSEGGWYLAASQDADILEDGKLAGEYVHTNLFVTDEAGTPLSPVPVPYVQRDDGTYAVPLILVSAEGEKTAAQLLCRRNKASGVLEVTDVCIYDEAIEAYSTRLSASLDMFETAVYQVEEKVRPQGDVLPPFDRWETKASHDYEWKLGDGCHLAFVRDILDTENLCVAFQITDVFNKVYMSNLVPLHKTPADGWLVKCDDDYVLVDDVSEIRPGRITARLTNQTDQEAELGVENVRVNGREVLLKGNGAKVRGKGPNGGMESGESQILSLRYDLEEGEETEELEFELVFYAAKSKEAMARTVVRMWHGTDAESGSILP